MKFIVIGITDDPQPFFSPEVLEIIRSGHIFSGGKRHHEIVAPLLPEDAEWIDITVPIEKVFEKYKRLIPNSSHEGREEAGAMTISRKSEDAPSLCEGLGLIVFASGDPLFFGFANTIKREMPFLPIISLRRSSS